MSSQPSSSSSLHRHSVELLAVAGLAATLIVGAITVLRPRTASGSLLLLLWLATGLGLGIIELLFISVVGRLEAALALRLRPRFPRLAAWVWPLLAGFFASPALVALGMKLFSGAGIRRLSVARIGPAVVVVVGAGVVVLATRVFLAVLAGTRQTRRAAACAALLLALAVLVLGARGIPLNYGYLWDATVAAAFALAQGALYLGRPSVGLGRGRPLATAALLVVFAGATVAVVRWPVSAVAGAALHDDDHPSGRLAGHWRRLIDFDGDGFSPVLGGGDCNDLDSSINPLAIDIPGDGIDQDCDGADLSPEQAQVRVAFWSSRPWARPAAAAAAALAPPARTSVVLITIDALRADHAQPTVGSLEELWRGSVRFDHAYAPSSSTRLSLPMLVTSRLAPTGGRRLALTLAARLRAAGFRTALVGFASPFDILAEQKIEVSPSFDLNQGSIRLDGNRVPIVELQPSFDLKQGFDRVDLVHEGKGDSGFPVVESTTAHDGETTDRALAAARSLAASPEPFFLWVHFFDPHEWEHVVTALPGESAESRYGRAVKQTLGEVSRLQDGLKLILQSRPVITVLSADHGEALGERHYRHHTRFLYDFLVRIPLLIRAPGVTPQDIHEPVSLLDLVPTLLELAGAGLCTDCSGDSLVPLFGSKVAAQRRALLLRDNDQAALILDGWKLLFSPRANRVELYPLDDERPSVESSAAHPELAREMLGLLRISPLRRFPPLLER